MKSNASTTLEVFNAESEEAKIPEAGEVKEITKYGISVRIRPTIKNGITRFVLDYRANGQRKLVWRSTMADARKAANEAIDKITEGQAEVLNLKSADAHAIIRARAFINGREGEMKIEKEIDELVGEICEIRRLLGGRATPLEVIRNWLRCNAVELPKITVADAVEQMKKQAETDGKSDLRLKQLANVLDRFAENINQEVHTLTPKMIADYLTALELAERTRRNHRDVIGFFNRWLVLRGYLAKGTDWLEGVQNYTSRKLGQISTYTADEMRRLITAADDRILPMIVIGGFAGLRHAEIARLEWQDIDLEEGFIEVKAENAKTDTRRIVPLKANLKAFLLPLAKKSGKVVSLVNTTKQLLKTAAETADEENEMKALEWKHNALRHTYISARVAESGDVPRVADEAGNSPQVIRTNYLKRIRPAAAVEWFGIMPANSSPASK
ncbi:MAG TPA: tyrosine-type recombinase/integrase [Candidatus Paceibacterota bacterium]|nr:tyrosine-type recombinase/integrase [Candidatus Paceibacterota bacterium]